MLSQLCENRAKSTGDMQTGLPVTAGDNSLTLRGMRCCRPGPCTRRWHDSFVVAIRVDFGKLGPEKQNLRRIENPDEQYDKRTGDDCGLIDALQ
ncbi:MAG: hypothetical protein WD669_02615 [Pirellulales bacterium]